MSADSPAFPLSSLPHKVEIPLARAPLIRVLTQVRFPPAFSFDKQEKIEELHNSLKESYPVARCETAPGIITPEQEVLQRPENIWQFCNIKNDASVVIAKNFITFSTSAYSGRKKFFEDFSIILNAFNEHISPIVVERIGVRYMNRLVDEALNKIDSMIRPEILGVTAKGFLKEEKIYQSFSEILYETKYPDTHLFASWGFVPSDTKHRDIEAIDKKSWILNMDMFSNEKKNFVLREILETVEIHAECIHSFFRWVVTDNFIAFYGGEI